jgi:type IV pilus assembly protein PilE
MQSGSIALMQRLSKPPRTGTVVARHLKHRLRGFTLIELMIVVAIVAILAAVAYPSYTSYITRSNRSAVQGYMLEVSNLQQRYLLDARSYAADLTTLNSPVPSNVSSNYSVVTAPKTGTTVPGFTITATPVGGQLARDTNCAVLKIDESGKKEASGGGTSCW